MILEIKKLFAKGCYTGNFSFEDGVAKDLVLLPLCSIGSVKVEGEYEIFDNEEVEISLRISYKLVGQCSYCLADTQKDISYSADVLYVTDPDDRDNYVYDGYKLDLSSAVNDALLFSQPKVLLCKEDCKGIKLN